MSAPTVTAVSPLNNAVDVVLGVPIVVTFDQLINHSTVNDGTFSVTGPGQTLTITPDQTVAQDPEPVTGREYLTGTFAFDDTSGHTVVTFTPDKRFQPDSEYTVLVLGNDGVLSSDSVKNLTAEPMTQSFRWKFKAGNLNVVTPPVSSPLPDALYHIDPKSIVVIPRPPIGNDLSGEIDIIFPAAIDISTFVMNDILVSVEAILQDPSVNIPAGLVSSAVVTGNKLRITISGWPT